MNVVYHTCLDFECAPGDIILIYEADELIHSNPARFAAKLSNHRCICLTATPDNADKSGVEREVILSLGFAVFNGTADMENAVAGPGMNKTIDVGCCSEEFVSFILKELLKHAILLYCSLEF